MKSSEQREMVICHTASYNSLALLYNTLFYQIALKSGRYRKCDGFVSRNDGKQNVPVFMENCGVIRLPGGFIV